MARRRRFQDSPIIHLSRAAESHARIVAGEPHPSELPAEEQPEPEPSGHSRAAQRQRREAGGKFA